VLALLAPACSDGGGAVAKEACAASAESALKACAGAATVKGVDVSVYQGSVDWSAAYAAGVRFAFARVSDGTGHPDTEFAANWPKMKAAGVVRGVYQFFRPAEDPAAQAALLVQMLGQSGGLEVGDLPPVMDMEVTDNTPDATIRAHMQTWFDAVHAATGRVPMIYTAPSMSATIGAGFGAYPLWVANWQVTCPSIPAGWMSWAFWQSSDTATVNGVSGAVDLDEFDGSLQDLLAFAGMATTDAGGVGVAPLDGGAPPAPDAGAGAATGGAAMGAGRVIAGAGAISSGSPCGP
jgi:lysozyme